MSARPGDRCEFITDPGTHRVVAVQHYGCDQHPDGVVTDARTGEVVPA